jgi:anamorsin
MPSMAVSIDLSSDFDPAPTSQTNVASRSLLLAPPSIAAHEEKLRQLFTTFDRSATDLQMLDRLSAGFVSLPLATYDLVLVLTDTDGSRRSEALQLLTRDVYTALVPSMKTGGKLQFQHGALDGNESRETILSGLVGVGEGIFEKQDDEDAVVPLKLGFGKKNGVQNGVQNGLRNGNGLSTKSYDFGDDASDDELINEDDLLSEEDMKKTIQLRK